jgi:glyoxylase-like metal-dependent hydrolase (beta-lactamase superfamily II)
MAEVKVLVKGYAKEVEEGWLACSTSTLIKSNNNLIIFDPGCNKKNLIEALEREKIKIEDINFIILSHGHLDHALLTGMFSKAKVISFESLLYDNDLMLEFEEDILGKDTKIIKTPGHCAEHISLIVKTDKGKYVVAGDIFWWADDEEQIVDINKEDDSHPVELDMKKLIKSRKKVLEIADYIIPGHGDMFKVKK